MNIFNHCEKEFICRKCGHRFQAFEDEDIRCDICEYIPLYQNEFKLSERKRRRGVQYSHSLKIKKAWDEKINERIERERKLGNTEIAKELQLLYERKTKTIEINHHYCLNNVYKYYVAMKSDKKQKKYIYVLKSELKDGEEHIFNKGLVWDIERGYYIFKYHHVMEKLLGRRLMKGETVHHRDGDHSNDAKENLQLCIQHKYGTGKTHPQGFDTQHTKDINILLQYIGCLEKKIAYNER